MLRREVLTMTRSILLAISIPLAASGGAPGSRAEPALPMKIDLQVGGEKYAFTGPGVCQSSGDASIYELPATMYAVRQNGDGQSLTLTLWRPKTGAPDMLTLGVSRGARSYRVSTVKVGRQGDVRGSGRPPSAVASRVKVPPSPVFAKVARPDPRTSPRRPTLTVLTR